MTNTPEQQGQDGLTDLLDDNPDTTPAKASAPKAAKPAPEEKPAKAPKGKTYVVAIASIVERVKGATVTHQRGDVCCLAKADAEALIARGDARRATAGDLAEWKEANR